MVSYANMLYVRIIQKWAYSCLEVFSKYSFITMAIESIVNLDNNRILKSEYTSIVIKLYEFEDSNSVTYYLSKHDTCLCTLHSTAQDMKVVVA